MPIHKWVYVESYCDELAGDIFYGKLLLPKNVIEAAKVRIQSYEQNKLPLEGQSIGTPYLIDYGVVRITNQTCLTRHFLLIELFHESEERLEKLARKLELPFY